MFRNGASIANIEEALGLTNQTVCRYLSWQGLVKFKTKPRYVVMLKRKSTGNKRKVLSYHSISEAEIKKRGGKNECRKNRH